MFTDCIFLRCRFLADVVVPPPTNPWKIVLMVPLSGGLIEDYP